MLPSRTEYSEDYLKWLKWEKERLGENFRPLTSFEHIFVEFCLQNKEIISHVGDPETKFISVRKFLKQ